MRKWYIIYAGLEWECSFVSVNLMRCWMHLSMAGKTFKVVYKDKKDYEYAKRGNEVSATAQTKSQHKAVKIIFK